MKQWCPLYVFLFSYAKVAPESLSIKAIAGCDLTANTYGKAAVVVTKKTTSLNKLCNTTVDYNSFPQATAFKAAYYGEGTDRWLMTECHQWLHAQITGR